MTLDVRPFGDRAVLIQPAATEGPRAVGAWVLTVTRVARAHWPHAEVTAGLASVLVSWSEPRGVPAGVAESLDELVAAGGDEAAIGDSVGVEHLVAVRYDGADLPDVARVLGVPAAELVTRHVRQSWLVAAIGFAPGFAYLTGSDELFDRVPRLPDPRRQVPPGAVGVAAGMCAVYPAASPGGWQLLGSTDVAMFDPARLPPARLAVGDTVRFVAEA